MFFKGFFMLSGAGKVSFCFNSYPASSNKQFYSRLNRNDGLNKSDIVIFSCKWTDAVILLLPVDI
jgi:hypothetical protein